VDVSLWVGDFEGVVGEEFGASLGGTAGGFAVDVAGGGQPEGGGDDGAAVGVEAAGQFAVSVEDARQVQRPPGWDRVAS
jgi:hypothetical protein